MMKRILAGLLSALLTVSPVLAQSPGFVPSGQVLGNPAASRALAAPATVTSILDRALGSTRGSIITRTASGWVILTPGTLGLPLKSAGAGADVLYGILPLTAGGTNANLTASNGGIFYSTASAGAILSGTATAGQILQSGASTAPTWSTMTYPATGVQGDVLYVSATNILSRLAKDANATRYLANSGGSNNPAWAQITLTNGVTGILPIANGGTNCGSALPACLDSITGFSSTGIMSRTGVGTYSFSTLTALMDSGLCSTRGNVIYRGVSSWSCLTNGASGTVLSSNGVGADPTWIPVAGTGTVTSVDASGGAETLTGSAITSSGTIRTARLVNAQTGTTYTVLDTDRGKLVTHTNGSSIAVTLPQAGGGGSFVSGWYAYFQNRGVGTATITPTTSTVDGAANIALATGQGVLIASDGTNYFTTRGRGVTSIVASTGLTGGTISTSGSIAVDYATAAEFFNATASKSLQPSVVYTAEVTTTFGSTTTFDFNNFIHTAVTLTGNITTQSVSNARAGKAGVIRFIQDGTGSRTTVWNSAFKFAGGITPTLSTAINAIDVLSYFCSTATYCISSLAKDVK